MKESKLLEMRNQIDTLGRVATKLTQDFARLQMIVLGDHQVIKRLTEFPEIIKQLEDEQKENATGSTTGDSGSTDAGLELGDTSN